MLRGRTRSDDVQMPPYVAPNDRERARLRALVHRLSDAELAQPVHDDLTVAGILCHLAFWDARALNLARKVQAGLAPSPGDAEPDDVDWINDAVAPLAAAIPPRQAAELALRLAEEVDALVAALDPARLWPEDPASHVNPLRAGHRAEHLDEIEAALGPA